MLLNTPVFFCVAKKDEKSILAALRALQGEDPTNGALFFYNPDISSDKWIRTLPVLTRIGNHVFAYKG